STTVRVRRSVNLRDVPQWHRQQVRFSYLRRDGRARVIVPGEDLLPRDGVVAVGVPVQAEAVARALGEARARQLADQRAPAERPLPVRCGAVVTRVGRGDLELLARDDLVLEPGDRLAVVVERGQLDAVHTFLGDSDQVAGGLDVLSLGLGLVLGVALGLVTL